MANNNKTESRAITALRSIIDEHQTMEHHFNEGDKEMSWDGFIRIFLSDNDVPSKKNYDDDVPVQIKGHVNSANIGRERVQQSVDMDDLWVYYRNRGCLYFQIFLSEDGRQNEVFYTSLVPSKIQYYLSGEKQQTITIPFVRLPRDCDKFYNVVKQFSIDSRKQGFGEGPVMSKRITIDELKNVEKMTTETVGVSSLDELLKRFSTGDVSIYTEFGGGIPVPLPWSDQLSASMTITIKDTIGVKDRVYYHEFILKSIANGPGSKEFSLEGQTVIKTSPNLSLTFRDGNVDFKIEFNSDLAQIGHDVKFLLDLVDSQSLMLGDTTIGIVKPKVEKQFRKQMEAVAFAADVLNEANILISVPFKELTNDDKKKIDFLCDIKDGRIPLKVDKDSAKLHWEFRGKQMPLLVSKTAKGISLTNIPFDRTLTVTINSEKTDKLPKDALIVPNIAMLDVDVLSNLYYYDYESLYEQIDRSVFSEKTENVLNNLALHLITAYDINGEAQLLDVAKTILERLLEANQYVVQVIINLLQIEKRKTGMLSEESKVRLATLPGMLEACADVDDTDIKLTVRYCTAVLLDDFTEADKVYKMMGDNEKQSVDGYPIQALRMKS